MTRSIILPKNAPRPVSYYSHGIKMGNHLYTAGQTARDTTGVIVGQGDVQRQAQQAFKNLSLVLADAGMDCKDVVRLNIFIRAATDLPTIMNVKSQYFKDQQPALTCAVVNSLAFPEYLLEVEAIAIAE